MKKKILQIKGISYFRYYFGAYKWLFIGVLLFISYENFLLAQTNRKTGNPDRIISFSGYDWLVKSSYNTVSGTVAPGNNYFSNSIENVWIDKNGWLHLKITQKNGNWYCAEVTLTKPLGCKRYIFQVNSRVDLFHPNVVGGLFLYLDGKDNAEEIDINSTPTNSKLVVDEWNYSGKNVPADMNGKIHINLWLFQREKIDPDDRPETELIINSFQAL